MGYTVALFPISYLWFRTGEAYGRDKECEACERMLLEWHLHASGCGVRFGVECDCPRGKVQA